MRIFTVEHHHYHHLDRPLAEALVQIHSLLGALQSSVNQMQIDTSKLLAEVARQKTDNDSLRALVQAQTTAMAQISQKLADAIEAEDPVALQAVQTDLDKATTDLSLDSDKTEAALNANVIPTTAPATPVPSANAVPQQPPAAPPAAPTEPSVPPVDSGPAPMGGPAAAQPADQPAAPTPANPS